jgi:histidine triad (HIT) family protein
MDCIFCKIVAGSVPSYKVYEDTSALAFMDINPLSEGHALVIPKTHAANVWEIGETTLKDTIAAVRIVALGMKAALGIDSMNLAQANGPWALQSVNHLHFHLIPRRENDGVPFDWPLIPGDHAKIKALSAKVAAAMGKS